MNIWTRTSRFGEIFRSASGNSPETHFYASDPDVQHYFWPNDALPENWPSDWVFNYLYDGDDVHAQVGTRRVPGPSLRSPANQHDRAI